MEERKEVKRKVCKEKITATEGRKDKILGNLAILKEICEDVNNVRGTREQVSEMVIRTSGKVVEGKDAAKRWFSDYLEELLKRIRKWP